MVKSFKINISDYFDIELTAMFKTLFDRKVINPSDDDLRIVEVATQLVENPRVLDDPEESLSYFICTWLPKACDPDSRQDLRNILSTLKEKTEQRISFLRDVEKNKKLQKKKEKALIKKEIESFLEVINKGLSEEETEISRETIEEADKFFMIPLRELSRAELIAYVIAEDSVADFYFLRCQRAYSIKADFILQCVKNKDFDRAEALVKRIIHTATYPDFYNMEDSTGHWKGYSWEWEAKNTISSVMHEIRYQLQSEHKESPSKDEIQEILKLAGMVIPYLKKATAQELMSEYACLCSNGEATQQKYIIDLLDDVRKYARKPRPRGYGNAQAVNRISSEIIESFRTLDHMWKPEILAQELIIIEAAGNGLSPINFYRFMDRCVGIISEKMACHLIQSNPELIQTWLMSKPMRHNVDVLVDKVRLSGETIPYNNLRTMILRNYSMEFFL